MPRKKRHQFKFNEESVNKLLQEIYDDSHNIRSKIIRLFNKWETHATEGGEIAAIGDQIVKLITAEAKNQDQKIMLLKYLKEVVFNEQKEGKGKSGSEDKLDSDKKKELMKMVQEEVSKRKTNKDRE